MPEIKEPPKQPATTDEGLAFVSSLFEQNTETSTNPSTPTTETKPADGQGSGTTPSEGSEVGKDKGTTEQPTASAEAPKPPTPEPAPDLSEIPEEIRSYVATLSKEKQDKVKEAVLLRPTFTKKTQELSKQREEYETGKVAAENWNRLKANPAALEAAINVLRGSQPAVDPKPVFQYQDATAEEIEAHIDARIEERAKVIAAKIADERVDARVVAPVARSEGVMRALRDLAQERGLTEAQVAEAALAARDHYEGANVVARSGWTPENAAALVMPFLPAKQEPQANKAPSTNGSAPAPRVAAPGRGSGVTAPEPLPIHIREKRAPKNDRERVEHAAYLLREKWGISVNAADLEDLR